MPFECHSDDGSLVPFYQEVNGFRIPGMFPRETFLSALAYKPRPDDLFVVTFPKCGTTWVLNIVGSIYRGGRPYDSVLELLGNTAFLEFTGADGPKKMKRPGAIKLHLPFHLTPYSPLAKYIFVARNPKDTCVSFYHHTKNLPVYKFHDGKFNDYFEIFLEGKTDFGDYFDTLLSWYEHRNDSNVLFLTYEELKKDTKKNVLRIAEFMGSEYKETMESDPEMLYSVIKHNSFDYMRKAFNEHFAKLYCFSEGTLEIDPSIPEDLRRELADNEDVVKLSHDHSQFQFIRKGTVGDWKNYFSEDQSARLEVKFRERTKGTDIPKLWEDCMWKK